MEDYLLIPELKLLRSCYGKILIKKLVQQVSKSLHCMVNQDDDGKVFQVYDRYGSFQVENMNSEE